MVRDVAGAPAAPEAVSASGLRRAAVVCAALIVAAAVLDIALMFLDREVIVPGATPATTWLVMLHEHRFVTLRNLGLLNVVNVLLEVPLFLALRDEHRGRDRGRELSRLAVVLLVLGGAVYIARNSVFSLDALARVYATAPAESRPALVAAAEALLAAGEDLTGGMFMGFFLTELAGLLMALALVRGRLLGRAAGIVGVVGFGSLLAFNVLAAFAPALYGMALALGTVGGLAMIAWYVLVARGLLRLPRRSLPAS